MRRRVAGDNSRGEHCRLTHATLAPLGQTCASRYALALIILPPTWRILYSSGPRQPSSSSLLLIRLCRKAICASWRMSAGFRPDSRWLRPLNLDDDLLMRKEGPLETAELTIRVRWPPPLSISRASTCEHMHM